MVPATANPVCSDESGGLVESTAAVFGLTVEWYAHSAADTPNHPVGERADVSGDGRTADYWYRGVGDTDGRDAVVPVWFAR